MFGSDEGVLKFPPYHMLDRHADELEERAGRTELKMRKLARLYDHTLAHGWDPKRVLDELEAKHGGIHFPEDKLDSFGRIFGVILWGELAAWNVSTELAGSLPDLDARKAATGQAFDEARHFSVLRDYMRRANVPVPPLNALSRRVLVRILDASSPLEKLSGMQLLVENLALAIFKRVADAKLEPVLTDLLGYIERDESRHVAFGALYLPTLLTRASRLERARLTLMTAELLALSVAQGRRSDADWTALGVNHRELALTSFGLHDRMHREMEKEQGAEVFVGVDLSPKQRDMLVDFLHPEDPDAMSFGHKHALKAFDGGAAFVDRVLKRVARRAA